VAHQYGGLKYNFGPKMCVNKRQNEKSSAVVNLKKIRKKIKSRKHKIDNAEKCRSI
jgi:hypothetical protein